MRKATEVRLPINAACSSAYLLELQDTLAYFKDMHDTSDDEAFQLLADSKLKVNTKMAQCSNPDDEKKIRDDIERRGGYDVIDKVIYKVRCKLVKGILQDDQAAEFLPSPSYHEVPHMLLLVSVT